MSTILTVRSVQVFNGTGTLHPFSTKYWVANPNFDADAPRLIGEAINWDSVAEIGGCSRADLIALVRRSYRGHGTVKLVWDDGRKPQNVRTYEVQS